MASKSSKVHYTLCLLFLFTFTSALLGTGKGALCSVGMGGCNAQCETRCETAHKGGQSSCDGPTNTCKCFYECPPPKQCSVGLGPCSQACNEDCCNTKCLQKFAGNPGAHGMCYSPIGGGLYNACLCYFQCS